mgnify:CR=1 FL=1
MKIICIPAFIALLLFLARSLVLASHSAPIEVAPKDGNLEPSPVNEFWLLE